MGCGSSTAQPAAVVPEAQAGPASPNKQKSQRQVQVQPKPAVADEAPKQPAGPASPGANPPKAKQHLRRDSDGEDGDAVDGAAPPKPKQPSAPRIACDGDGAHEAAAFWCAACEENLCPACDAAAHQQPQTQGHKRTPLGGASQPASDGMSSPNQRKQGKFVVTSAPAGSADNSGSAAPQPASSPPAGSAELRKSRFTVGKFDNSAGAGDKSPRAGAGPAVHLSGVGESELARMTRGELEQLWQRYDKDKNGVLSRNELKSLAADVVARLIQLVRDDLLRERPELQHDPARLDALVEKEKLFVLPGKNAKQSQQELARQLAETLDINGDGRVSMQEYLMQWNEFASDVFQLKKDGAIACSIM